MRFLVMVVATNEAEAAGAKPDPKAFAEMGKFNEELAKAGVLVDLAGLKPSSAGKRLVAEGSKRTVVDGPWPETKELIAGYWILETRTIDECVEWMKRAPNPLPGRSTIEIRPFFELSELPLDEERKASVERRGAEVPMDHYRAVAAEHAAKKDG